MSQEGQSDSELHLFSQSSLLRIIDGLDSDTREVINTGIDFTQSNGCDGPHTGFAVDSNTTPQPEMHIPSPTAVSVYQPQFIVPLPVQQYYSVSPSEVSQMQPAMANAQPNTNSSRSSCAYSPVTSPTAADTLPATPVAPASALLISGLHTTEGDFDGLFEFKVVFPTKTKITKSTPWVYSEVLNRLFAQMGTLCPVTFKISRVTEGLFVRATPFYTDFNNRHHPVTACHVHSDNKHGNQTFTPWMLCSDSYNAQIEQERNGHFSLLVPWFVSSTSLDLTFKFVCRNTCVGGPNRRSITVAFALENEKGEVIGKKVVEVKVVASPGRDQQKEEMKHSGEPNKPKVNTSSNTSPKAVKKETSKERRVTFQNEPLAKKKYYLEINEKRTYETLAPLRDSLDIVNALPPKTYDTWLCKTQSKSALKHRCTNTEHLSSVFLCPTDVVPSTETLRSPTQTPDSSTQELTPYHSNPNIDKDMKIAVWLETFDFDCYADTFSVAGLINMGQILHFTLKDLSVLRLTIAHGRKILEMLAKYCEESPLSQPSLSAEAIGLFSYHRLKPDLSSSSSNED